MAGDFEDGFFEGGGLFGGGALFAGELGAGFVFDLFFVGRGRRGADLSVLQESSCVASSDMYCSGGCVGGVGKKRRGGGAHTVISKSTILSAKVLIELLKQNEYSPTSFAVNTKSPCRSFVLSIMIFSLGPTTL